MKTVYQNIYDMGIVSGEVRSGYHNTFQEARKAHKYSNTKHFCRTEKVVLDDNNKEIKREAFFFKLGVKNDYRRTYD